MRIRIIHLRYLLDWASLNTSRAALALQFRMGRVRRKVSGAAAEEPAEILNYVSSIIPEAYIRTQLFTHISVISKCSPLELHLS